ncbi:MAG: hypothetical protein ACFCUI_00400 [Bernardetiaceae bacterium]
MDIQGTVKYQHLATGFWGIIGDDGSQWRPVEMPEALQKEGLRVSLEAEAVEEMFSIFMWGEPIAIANYQIQ